MLAASDRGRRGPTLRSYVWLAVETRRMAIDEEEFVAEDALADVFDADASDPELDDSEPALEREPERER